MSREYALALRALRLCTPEELGRLKLYDLHRLQQEMNGVRITPHKDTQAPQLEQGTDS